LISRREKQDIELFSLPRKKPFAKRELPLVKKLAQIWIKMLHYSIVYILVKILASLIGMHLR